jgi:hypothetical protein
MLNGKKGRLRKDFLLAMSFVAVFFKRKGVLDNSVFSGLQPQSLSALILLYPAVECARLQFL